MANLKRMYISENSSFGEKLRHMRDEVLEWTQKELAVAMSAQLELAVQEKEIRAWESNRDLEELQANPEKFRVLAEILFNELKGQVDLPSEYNTLNKFHDGLKKVLDRTIADQKEDKLELIDSFGVIIASWRREAKLSPADIAAASGVGTPYTGQQIAQVEFGAEPPEGFIAKLTELPQIKPRAKELQEAYEQQARDGWVVSIGKRPSQLLDTTHELPDELKNVITALNRQKRKIATYFLKNLQEGDSTVPDADVQRLGNRFQVRKEGYENIFFNATASTFHSVDLSLLERVNPAYGLTEQHPDVRRQVSRFQPLSEAQQARIASEAPEDKQDAIKADLTEYSRLVNEGYNQLRDWRNKLKKEMAKASDAVSERA